MKRRGNSLFFAAAAALALLSGGARADVSSDKAAAAETLFQEARALSAKGDYAAACPKFRASHELDPGYGVLFNLADCFTSLGKTASAWATYTEAAGIAKKAGEKDRIQKAEKRAADLVPKLEKVTISVASPAPSLVVKRDGVALDSATWGVALPVDPGKHTIIAEAPGKKTWTAEVQTNGPGSTLTIAIPALEDGPTARAAGTEAGAAASAPAGVATSVPPPDDGRGTRRIIGLVIAGAGVASIAAGAAMGGLAGSKWNDAQDNHCRTATLCDAAGIALAGDARSFATVSTAMFIGGGVLAAGGVALFALSLGSGKKEGTGLLLVPSAGSKSAALTVHGRF